MKTYVPVTGLSLLFALTLAAATPNQCNEQLDGKDAPVTLSADGKTKWIDGTQLPLEGRPFADAERPYQRIPDRLKAVTNVNIGVWKQGARSSSGTSSRSCASSRPRSPTCRSSPSRCASSRTRRTRRANSSAVSWRG